jgi:hypothetical protein
MGFIKQPKPMTEEERLELQRQRQQPRRRTIIDRNDPFGFRYHSPTRQRSSDPWYPFAIILSLLVPLVGLFLGAAWIARGLVGKGMGLIVLGIVGWMLAYAIFFGGALI